MSLTNGASGCSAGYQEWNVRKADHGQVITRYRELRSLAATGREFGISRERVRQIVNRAGIPTPRTLKPKPERVERYCKECGGLVESTRAAYCDAHRTPSARSRRVYLHLKADPDRYQRWRQQCNESAQRRRRHDTSERIPA